MISKFERNILQIIYNRKKELCLIGIVTVFFILRLSCFEYQSFDYKGFLKPWYDLIKLRGGLPALSKQVGDYGVPYQFLIAIFTYIPISSLYMYKLLSIIFDFVLAFYAAKLVKKVNPNQNFTVLFGIFLALPTVFINSALWGQVDSLYTAFCVLSLYKLLDNKIFLAFFFYGVALAFKLQAIFILPAYILVYLLKRNYSFIYFGVSIIAMYICNIPGFIYGRNLLTPITIYFEQTGTYKALNLTYPNFAALLATVKTQGGNIWKDTDISSMLRRMLTIFTLAILILIYSAILLKIGKDITNQQMITIFTLTAWTMVMFLPGMHERYGYLVDILLLISSMAVNIKFLGPATIMLLSSFITYCNVLFGLEYSPTLFATLAVISYLYYVLISFIIFNVSKDENTKIG